MHLEELGAAAEPPLLPPPSPPLPPPPPSPPLAECAMVPYLEPLMPPCSVPKVLPAPMGSTSCSRPRPVRAPSARSAATSIIGTHGHGHHWQVSCYTVAADADRITLAAERGCAPGETTREATAINSRLHDAIVLVGAPAAGPRSAQMR
jgi:hypothetical protein